MINISDIYDIIIVKSVGYCVHCMKCRILHFLKLSYNAIHCILICYPSVYLGAVTGELAGMTVPSDPYDFEEDEKDLNYVGAFNTSAADINLKQVGTWANRNNSVGPPNKLGNNVSFLICLQYRITVFIIH